MVASGLKRERAEEEVSERVLEAIQRELTGEQIRNLGAFVMYAFNRWGRANAFRERERILNALGELQRQSVAKSHESPDDALLWKETRHVVLDHIVRLPPVEQEATIAKLCENFEPHVSCEKIYHRLRELLTSRYVSNTVLKQLRQLKAVLAKHGVDPPRERRRKATPSKSAS